ncbi:UPF0058 family protein [Halorussus salinisoli]|uniref:UPF0058 family protein n=1 Tax=Halorussus salinisoli TaxID=2558242 RepID=UPI0010C233A3|nr:UPF0058 family protein [Halorussus salinisoli]
MRKQEYIHLHALLNVTREHLIACEGMPRDQLSAYHRLGVAPSSVQKSKREHHEAVMELATQIGTWVEESQHTEPELPVP